MLNDKVAVVTGAGRGIGRAIVHAFACHGARVAVADIDVLLAETTAATLREDGRDAIAVGVDVTSPDEVADLISSVVAQHGRLDILVNNAGIIHKAPSLQVTKEQWQRVLEVNLTGTFVCSQAAATVMIRHDGGSIINIASVGAHTGAAGAAAYSASKGGVVALTRALAVEWGPDKVRVNSISPTGIDTEMGQALRQTDPEAFARRDRRIPLGRAAGVEDVANAALFLASDLSSFITGRDIIVDGGLLSLNPGFVD